MELTLLILSAFVAGIVNTIAGGGTLLTFPALQGLGQLTALMANGTSTLALMPGSLAGGWGYRKELAQGGDRWLWLLLGPSVVGGVVGSWLAVGFNSKVFARVIPWLLLTATLLFLFQPLLAKKPREGEQPAAPTLVGILGLITFQFIVAVYGGYFGAGIGILMLSSLGLMGMGDIHRMNAVKTLLAAAINGVTAVLFIAAGQVDWRLAWPMALGSIAGGYAGASVGRLVPRPAVRWFVIAVGLGLSVWYFLKVPTGVE